jgi:hypothetical protein
MNVSNEQKQLARLQIVSSLNRNKNDNNNLSFIEKNAIKCLKSDDNIVILPSDKGKCTVVMNKCDYEEKALNLLNDSNTYEKVPSDPTKRLQRKVTKVLNDLRLEHILTD